MAATAVKAPRTTVGFDVGTDEDQRLLALVQRVKHYGLIRDELNGIDAVSVFNRVTDSMWIISLMRAAADVYGVRFKDGGDLVSEKEKRVP